LSVYFLLLQFSYRCTEEKSVDGEKLRHLVKQCIYKSYAVQFRARWQQKKHFFETGSPRLS